jgi:hypothetical protein
MEQEAHLAMQRALRSFDASMEVPEGAYLWSACMRHLSGYLWGESAPVSGPRNEAALGGLMRAQLDERRPVASTTRPDVQAERRQYRARLREEMRGMAQQIGAEPYLDAVLGGASNAREAAAATGLPVDQMYHQRARLVSASRNDARLYQLWQEDDS